MSERDLRAAGRVRAALRKALDSLHEFAERGAPSSPDGNLRELKAPFGRYGYFVQYRVRGDEVFVASIRHAREDRR